MTRGSMSQLMLLQSEINMAKSSRKFVEEEGMGGLMMRLIHFQPTDSCLKSMQKILLKDLDEEIQRLEKKLEELIK